MSIYESSSLLGFCVAVAALLGAAFGSFLNCAAWRIAHEEPFWKGRSRCPACGHTLGPAELIPILSWLLLRGKCRHCGDKISPRYLLTELFFAALTVGCLLRWDLSVLCLRNWGLLCFLFCLSLVDLECFIIPNGCLVGAAAVWLAALPFLWTGWHDVWMALLAGLVFGGSLLGISLVMDKVLGRESLGGGDVKLYAVLGLYLGLLPGLLSLILACVLGLVFAALTKARRPDAEFPFGPAISAAAALTLFFGDGVVAWYLHLF